MNDYQQNLKSDWEDFKAEVAQLLMKNPKLTPVEICESTGGDYEDVLWAMKAFTAVKLFE